jgi:hypothetical protein
VTKLRRYCWRVGVALELDDNDTCDECGLTGALHQVLPDQTKCGFYAAITDSHGGPCMLEIGHEGKHVPAPEAVDYYARQGKRIVIGGDDD